MRNPEFIIFTGPMFSSKTTRLLACLDRYRYQKRTIDAFKPMMDSRYKVSEIITHSGWRQKAHLIETGGDLAYWYNKVKHNTDILAIDEAFMIPEIGQVLIDLYKSGKTVLVSSLDLSANCNAFPEMEKIMPYATKIVKCSAVCSVCGSDAYYTHRKDGDNTEIAVGGSEMYEPRCFQHHMISLM